MNLKDKRIVLAIGGNSLIARGSKGTIEEQREVLKTTAKAIVDLYEMGAKLIITHGNGYQVGVEMEKNLVAKKHAQIPDMPLDVLVAMTQGMIGYLIQLELRNELEKRGIRGVNVVTLITTVLVDSQDPNFNKPSKPVGRALTESEKLIKEKEGWILVQEVNRGWRRVVPSPKPQKIMEVEIIRELLENNNIVITCGGGGIPIVFEENRYTGVEAVIDKDEASGLMASMISSNGFIISTEVDYVYRKFGTEFQEPIKFTTPEELKTLLEMGEFPEGSMAPKIRASIYFLEKGGEFVIITSPEKIIDAINLKAGTIVLRNGKI